MLFKGDRCLLSTVAISLPEKNRAVNISPVRGYTLHVWCLAGGHALVQLPYSSCVQSQGEEQGLHVPKYLKPPQSLREARSTRVAACLN